MSVVSTSKMEVYQEWIAQKEKVESPTGKCAEWTAAMLLEFPELTRVRGHVLLSNGLEREHWWLVDTDGEIVDPTKSQFPEYLNAMPVLYTPWEEGSPEPKGICAQCGDYIYWDNCSTTCSERCGRAYTAYLMSGVL